MGTPKRSCEGQQKSVRGFGACSEVSFVPKECSYINWDTLKLDIWIPFHYIEPSNFTLSTKKHQTYTFFNKLFKKLIICRTSLKLEGTDDKVVLINNPVRYSLLSFKNLISF